MSKRFQRLLWWLGWVGRSVKAQRKRRRIRAALKLWLELDTGYFSLHILARFEHCQTRKLSPEDFRQLCAEIYALGYPFNPMPELLPNERIRDFLLWLGKRKPEIAFGADVAFEVWRFKNFY